MTEARRVVPATREAEWELKQWPERFHERYRQFRREYDRLAIFASKEMSILRLIGSRPVCVLHNGEMLSFSEEWIDPKAHAAYQDFEKALEQIRDTLLLAHGLKLE